MLFVRNRILFGLLKFKIHIVIALLGIFTFPIAFQSIHIIGHHSHGFMVDQHICGTNAVDECAQAEAIDGSEKENQCPVCTYQFVIKSLSEAPFFTSILPVSLGWFNEIVIIRTDLPVFSNKSPRAPPSFTC